MEAADQPAPQRPWRPHGEFDLITTQRVEELRKRYCPFSEWELAFVRWVTEAGQKGELETDDS